MPTPPGTPSTSNTPQTFTEIEAEAKGITTARSQTRRTLTIFHKKCHQVPTEITYDNYIKFCHLKLSLIDSASFMQDFQNKHPLILLYSDKVKEDAKIFKYDTLISELEIDFDQFKVAPIVPNVTSASVTTTGTTTGTTTSVTTSTTATTTNVTMTTYFITTTCPVTSTPGIQNPVTVTSSMINPIMTPSVQLTSSNPRKVENISMKLFDKFSGRFEQFRFWWKSFLSTFDNTNADDQLKFQALWKYLDDESRILIAGCDDMSYDEAKRRLVRHYLDKFSTQEDILKRINRLEPLVNMADIRKLRMLVGIVEDTYRSLLAISADDSFLNLTYYKAVASKFPLGVIRQFTQKYTTKQPVDILVKFLNDKIEQVEFELSITDHKTIQTKKDFNPNTNPNHNPKTGFKNQQQSNYNKINFMPKFVPRNNNFVPKPKFNDNKNPKVKCSFCDGPHRSYSCPSSMTVFERDTIRKDKNLCEICLSPYHSVKDCHSPYKCTICGGRHSAIICRTKPQPKTGNYTKPGTNNNKPNNRLKPEIHVIDTDEENDILNIKPDIFMTLVDPKDDSMMVPAAILGRNLSVGYDTGSFLGSITTAALRKYKLTYTTASGDYEFAGGDGHYIGIATLPLTIGCYSRIVNLLVIDNDEISIIIGRENIVAFGLSMNCELKISQLIDDKNYPLISEITESENLKHDIQQNDQKAQSFPSKKIKILQDLHLDMNEKDNAKNFPKILLNAEINNNSVEGLYDTGADDDALTTASCDAMNLIYTPFIGTYSHTGGKAKYVGYLEATLKLGAETHNSRFVVIENKKPIFIIGRKSICKFKLEQDHNLNIHQVNGESRIPLTHREPLISVPTPLNEIEKDILQQEDNWDHLTESQQKALFDLLEEYDDIFAKWKGQAGMITTEMARIKLTSEVPITLRPYKATRADQEKIDECCKENLENDYAEESDSPFSFPVAMVSKKDEGPRSRMVTDLRRLNKILAPLSSYPIPRMEDLEDKLLDAMYLSALDMSAGFTHVVVHPDDRKYLSYVTVNGQYQFKRLTFGLRSAPVIFQRIIFNILRKHNLLSFSLNYFDDIAVWSKDFESHLKHLRQVFECFRQENILLKRSKCHFAQLKVIFLGHWIGQNQIRPVNSNISAIQNYPAPKNLKTLRRFIGKVTYYHRFIPNRSDLLAPLYDLTRKGVAYIWTVETQNAFEQVKLILISPPTLHIFNPILETYLFTDASKIGIGAVLKQVQYDNQMAPVGFFSRKLLSYQKNYVITELECLAMVESMKYWHVYLFGIFFTVVTDHLPLKAILKTKLPNTRLFNWSLRLNQYQFAIKYIPGKDNEEADCLSRNPDFEINIISLFMDIDEIKTIHKDMDLPKHCIREDGIIFRRKKDIEQIYLPANKAKEILQLLHVDYGHIGNRQMTYHYSTKYYTPKCSEIISEITTACDTCKRAKTTRQYYGFLGQYVQCIRPFMCINMDTVGGFGNNNSSKRYIHLAIDGFSRYCWALTSRTQMAADFINLLNKIFEIGVPDILMADKYAAINSKELRAFLKKKGIKFVLTPTMHPESNGIVEKLNDSIVQRLRCKQVEKPGNVAWTTLAKQVVFQYNRSVHTTLRFPPIYLLIGLDEEGMYKGQNLDENRNKAIENSILAHERHALYFNRNRKTLDLEFGDFVYLQTKNKIGRKKLDPIYHGPYKITNRVSDTIYEIQRGHKKELVHVAKLKMAQHKVDEMDKNGLNDNGHFNDENDSDDESSITEIVDDPISPPQPAVDIESQIPLSQPERVVQPQIPIFEPIAKRTRNRNQGWKPLLFNKTILAFFYFLMATGEASYPTSQPIIWRKTNHKISKKYHYGTVIMDHQNPCLALDNTTGAQIAIRHHCDFMYEMTVMKSLRTYCKPTNNTHILAPFRDNRVRLQRIRSKRALFGIIAVSVLVGTLIFGAYAIYDKFTVDASRIEELQTMLMQDMAKLKAHGNITAEIHEKVLAIAKRLIKEDYVRSVADYKSKIQTVLVAAIISHIVKVESLFVHFFNGLSQGKVTSEFTYLFPNVSICGDGNCPLEFMRSYGCEQIGDDFVLKLSAVEIEPSKEIYRADPFKIVKEVDSEYCFFGYHGNHYVMRDKRTNCSQDLLFDPINPSVPHTFFLYDQDLCNAHVESRKMWNKEWCEEYTALTKQHLVQIKTDDEFNYIYCYKQFLQVNDMVKIQCTNDVYKLDRTLEITINNMPIPIERIFLQSVFDIDPSMDIHLNDKVFPNFSRNTEILNQLQTLIKKEKMSLDDIDIPGYVFLNSINLYIIGGAILTMLIIILLVYIYFCYFKKLAHHRNLRMLYRDGNVSNEDGNAPGRAMNIIHNRPTHVSTHTLSSVIPN